MNRIVITSVIGAVAAAAVVVGAGAPAFAGTPSPTPSPKTTHSLASVQAASKIAADKRETALSAAITKLDAAKGVSSSDKATLLGRLNTDLAGMKSVEAKVATDTTLSAAVTDSKTLFTTYRVLGLAIPQAHVVAAVDRATTLGIPKLTAAETKLTAALAGKDASKSTAALQADLADMKTQTAAAASALSGVSAMVLALTPSEFNSNKTVVKSIRTSVKSAIADLKKVRTDRKAIVSALK
jgi:hypothetical protein